MGLAEESFSKVSSFQDLTDQTPWFPNFFTYLLKM